MPMCLNWLIMAGNGLEKGDYNGIFRPSESVCSVQTTLLIRQLNIEHFLKFK